MIENSPHMEAFRAKGYEVLLLTDPVDEVWVERVGQFDGRHAAVHRQGPGRPGHRGGRRRRPRPSASSSSKDFAALLDLDERPASTEQRQGGPALLPADHLAGLHRRRRPRHHADAGEDVPGDGPGGAARSSGSWSSTPATRWSPACARRTSRAATRTALAETAELLYGMALLAEGGELADPSRFTRLLADRLARTL